MGGRPRGFGQGGLPLRPGVLVPVALAVALQQSSCSFLGLTALSGSVAVLMTPRWVVSLLPSLPHSSHPLPLTETVG